ncbi:MAG: peptidylprolyl isomerase [Candidatus Pacearchaeota archaeon]|nr:peptidylprolyl isomerase [Candidatus Pacearchaeota archaeon]
MDDNEKFLRNKYDPEFLREIFNPEVKKVMILETYRGEIVIELFHKDVSLTEDVLTKALVGEYNGITFHNCNPFFVQIRKNFGETEGKRRIIVPYLKNTRGYVGLVNSKKKPENSLLDHFYICLKDIPEFNERYTVIGRVVKGLDVLNKIWDGNTVKNVRIEKDYDKKRGVKFKFNLLFWLGFILSIVSLIIYLSTKINLLKIAQDTLFKKQITDLIPANISLLILGAGIILMLFSIIFAPLARKRVERQAELEAIPEPKERIFPEEKVQPSEGEQESLKKIEQIRINASLMRGKEEARRKAEEEEKRILARKIVMEEEARRKAEEKRREKAEEERRSREEAIKKKLEGTRQSKEQQEKMKKLKALEIKSREIMQKEQEKEEKRKRMHEEQEIKLLAEQKKIEEERRKEEENMMRQEEERRKLKAQKEEKEQQEKMKKLKALEIKSTELFKKEKSERENLRKEFVQKMDTGGNIGEEIKKKGKEEIKADILPKIAKRTETHLDVLFDLLERYGVLKMSYIVQTFNIDKEEALEWCNILVEHDLAELDYPAFGEPTLKKKEQEPAITEK